MQITLPAPITVDGHDVTEITLDLDGLTGLDLEEAGREFDALAPGYVGMQVMDSRYLVCVASKACGLSVDVLRRLPAPVYTKVTLQVQGFLLGSA